VPLPFIGAFVFLESLVPVLADLSDGALVDPDSSAIAVAQRTAKRMKNVFREFIVVFFVILYLVWI
jgi:hypothetical protein